MTWSTGATLRRRGAAPPWRGRWPSSWWSRTAPPTPPSQPRSEVSIYLKMRLKTGMLSRKQLIKRRYLAILVESETQVHKFSAQNSLLWIQLYNVGKYWPLSSLLKCFGVLFTMRVSLNESVLLMIRVSLNESVFNVSQRLLRSWVLPLMRAACPAREKTWMFQIYLRSADPPWLLLPLLSGGCSTQCTKLLLSLSQEFDKLWSMHLFKNLLRYSGSTKHNLNTFIIYNTELTIKLLVESY